MTTPLPQEDPPPSTNAMIPYVAPSLPTHNFFAAISNKDVQEDLMAHAKLNEQRDQNYYERDENGTTTNLQHLDVIP